jgi:hypothetical protein
VWPPSPAPGPKRDMSDDKKPFTVKDRRHFTAEGETRDETVSDQPAAREDEPPRPPAATVKDTAASEAADPGRARPTLDFAGLLLSLGAQASLLLGLGDDDEGGPAPDFQGAQAIISLLEVLRDKTDGRRTPEEDRILQGILYELRMAYVSGTRAGGA